MENKDSRKYIIIAIVSGIIIVSLLLFGAIYSFSSKKNVNSVVSIRDEHKEDISNELEKELGLRNGYIDPPSKEGDEVKPYWEKERQPITKGRAQSLVDNTIKGVGSMNFSEAQNNVDKVFSEYDPSGCDIYNENADLFLDLVIMSNYDDLFGIDDENIINQIKNCKDERVILASTLKLEPNLYQYVVQSPDSILPVIGDSINFGELITVNKEDEKINLLESIIPFANKYTELSFESDNVNYKAFFAHTDYGVRLLYIIDEPTTGRLNTIKEWSNFFTKFEHDTKED